MAFKMRYNSKGDSPWHKENKQVPAKDPAKDKDWVRREVNRHKELGLNYDHLTKYMTDSEKIKYKKK